jgi:hypothetical protein
MNNKEKLKERILTEPDFIYSPKYGNSLDAAKVLLMEKEEVDRIYEEAIENLKKLLGVDDE